MKSYYMKSISNKSYILTLLLSIICMLLLPAQVSKAERIPGEAGAVSNNISKQNYSTWASPMKSYLYVNSDNTLTRVELIADEIIYENYDQNFKLISKGTINKELVLFGGFYAGQNANYFVFGQYNREELKDREVIRVVKYSKDWKRLGSCSLSDCNTTVPFYVGSLRFAECGDMLYIRTAHEMYTTSDGLNHQANLMMSVNTSSMEITDSLARIINIEFGYVSHSFNQFIKVNGKELVAVDHGDALPRSIVLIKYDQPAGQAKFRGLCTNIDLLVFPGEIGKNSTGGSVGGFEISSSSYLVAGNYSNTGSNVRNIFLSVTPQGEFVSGNTKLLYLTQYDKSSKIAVSTPQLVKVNDDSFMVLWETTDKDTNQQEVNYIMVNGKGESESEVRKVQGNLSDCQPIVFNNKVTWYYTDESCPVFCTLPSDGSDPKDNLIKGDEFVVKNIVYSVIKSTDSTKTVAVKGVVDTLVTKLTIPATIEINGDTYKVTEVSDEAFINCYELKTLTFGSNITKIGRNCVTYCIKKIVIKSTKLKTVDKNAFEWIPDSAVIQVPKSKLSAYKKLLKSEGQYFKIEAIK